MAHRKLLSHAKVMVRGEATRSVPSMMSSTYFVGASHAWSVLYTFFQGSGLVNSHIARTTTIIVGQDPFTASAEFASRFKRSAMPVDVGGELKSGEDGYCCLGVEQPALCDEDAVWAKYVHT